MTQIYGEIKVFACCKKEGICLKLWILIFVCALLCLTCFLIENRRDSLSKNGTQNSKQGAQKLIQISSKRYNEEINNELEEESSGFHMESINFSSAAQPEELINITDVTDETRQKAGQKDGQEMPVESNCISKKDNFRQNMDVAEVDEYNYKDNFKKLFELPAFTETETQVLMSSNELNEIETPFKNQQMEAQLQADSNIGDVLSRHIKHNNENFFQLTSHNLDTSTVGLDLEDDRFFPDEYAFQDDLSTDSLSAEFLYPYNKYPEPSETVLNSNVLKDVPIENVDLPTIIDTFLGRISMLLVPPVKIMNSYHDVNHLKNFQESTLNADHMKLSSSRLSPVWRMKPTPTKKFNRKLIKPTTIATSQFRKNTLNNKNYGSFFQQLLGIKTKK